MNQFEQLSKVTIVVADTGDIDAISKLKPTDATTNPTLMLQAANIEKYSGLVDEAIAWGATQTDNIVNATMDKLAVNFGVEILKHVPGVVSTEVDARLSFDIDATIERARHLIKLYEAAGIARERVLIKIAATWEGAQAARVLEQEGITCNLTLIFSLCQAIACAEANAHLISPFVGRILDWFKAKGNTYTDASTDPGVVSVSEIYNHYKTYGYKTIVMGASFRNADEIRELAGCDKLTISPKLLDELAASTEPLPVKLVNDKQVQAMPTPMSEAQFRWALNQDAMATEKLAEGIRNFAIDCEKLETLVRTKLTASGVTL